jgi:prevent-host-death family protein
VIDPAQIHPLTDFQRNAKKHLARLKRSGRPEVLTVNGRPAAVVQDPEAFFELSELAAEAVEMRRLAKAIDEMNAGKGKPLREVVRGLKSRRATRRKTA